MQTSKHKQTLIRRTSSMKPLCMCSRDCFMLTDRAVTMWTTSRRNRMDRFMHAVAYPHLVTAMRPLALGKIARALLLYRPRRSASHVHSFAHRLRSHNVESHHSHRQLWLLHPAQLPFQDASSHSIPSDLPLTPSRFNSPSLLVARPTSTFFCSSMPLINTPLFQRGRC